MFFISQYKSLYFQFAVNCREGTFEVQENQSLKLPAPRDKDYYKFANNILELV